MINIPYKWTRSDFLESTHAHTKQRQSVYKKNQKKIGKVIKIMVDNNITTTIKIHLKGMNKMFFVH
jgi:hypothetical protein